jgi:hypothetical protein
MPGLTLPFFSLAPGHGAVEPTRSAFNELLAPVVSAEFWGPGLYFFKSAIHDLKAGLDRPRTRMVLTLSQHLCSSA